MSVPALCQALRLAGCRVRRVSRAWPAADGDLWRSLRERGEVYVARFAGWHCGACQRFYADHEIDDGPSCPRHPGSVARVDTDCWWFRLASHHTRMRAYHAAVEQRGERPFVMPDGWRSRVRRRLAGEVADVPLFAAGAARPAGPPGGELTNAPLLTLAAAWTGTDPDTVYVVPDGDPWWCTVVWPAMLLAAGHRPPAGVVTGQGWGDGTHRSGRWPSLPAQPVIDDLGADALRYLMVRLPAGPSPVTADALVDCYQAELAGGLANLVARTTAVATRAEPDGAVPRPADVTSPFDVERLLRGLRGRPHPERVMDTVDTLVRSGNAYLESQQPWRQDPVERARTLWHALELCRVLAHLTGPVFLERSRQLLAQLGVPEPAHWPVWGGAGSGFRVAARTEPLFPAATGARRRRMLGRWEQAAAQSSPELEISPADFGRLDLRVARIAGAEPVSTTGGGAVLRLRLDLGGEHRIAFSTRLARTSEPRTLVGRMVVYLANLQPVEIAGFVSHGMVLAARDDETASLLGFDRTHEPGSVMF
jgi:methionyl-tRNA synthetase